MTKLNIYRLPLSFFNKLSSYNIETWWHYRHIGLQFPNGILTREDYQIVEDRYVRFLLELIEICGLPLQAKEFDTSPQFEKLTEEEVLLDYHQELEKETRSSFTVDARHLASFLKLWFRTEIYADLYLGQLKLIFRENKYILQIEGDEFDIAFWENLVQKHQLFLEDITDKPEIVCLRVTKYNPIYRNEKGWYMKEEWTDFSDIGESFDGKMLTKEGYEEVEQHYISMIDDCFKALNTKEISLTSLDWMSKPTKDKQLLPLYEKLEKQQYHFPVSELPNLVQLLLRKYIEGAIIGDKIECYFGFDFYTYILTTKEHEETIYKANTYPLFVEDAEYYKGWIM